jgi:hypothetical protein
MPARIQKTHAPSSHAVESYLNELALLRKPATHRDATYCLRDYLPFANPQDIKGGILEYLAACRAKGNCMRTIQKRLVRVLSFYNSIGHPIKIPMPSLPAYFAACSSSRVVS